MHLQTKAIIITAIGICSLFFLSSVEAKASSYTLTSSKQSTSTPFSSVSHRYNDKRYIRNSPKRHKSSSRHKREKIGALLGGVLIGTAIASNARSSYSSRGHDHRSYGKHHKHTSQCRHRDTYQGHTRHHNDKNYTGYRGYRDNHRYDRHDYRSPRHQGHNNYRHHTKRNQHSLHGRQSGSKTYAPNYELRRDHNDRLSCYRVKMYRKGEKVLERVDRDYCGW